MLQIDPQIRAEIVKLRKLRIRLVSISEDTGINVVYVSNILKEELGDQYYIYSLKKPKKIFSDQEKKELVALRKEGNSLESIKELTNNSVHNIQKLLKEELGDKYLDYGRRYKKKWCEEDLKRILELRNRGKSLKEIETLTRFSNYFIKKILIEAGEGDLIPETWNYKRPLTKEQVISKFKRWYYKFAREMKVGSPRVLGPLKTDATETFLVVLEGLPQPSHKRDKLMPVFVYTFFRAKGFNVTFSLLKKLSGLTRHECFHMLKKINGIFPEYITRDRKQVVLDKIREVESSFQLNSRFFETASKILQKLWGILNNTTDRVIAGTVCALTLIALNNNSPILYSICQKVEIQQSAVIYQTKKLVKRFRVSGFTTLGESKELLRSEVLEKVVGI